MVYGWWISNIWATKYTICDKYEWLYNIRLIDDSKYNGNTIGIVDSITRSVGIELIVAALAFDWWFKWDPRFDFDATIINIVTFIINVITLIGLNTLLNNGRYTWSIHYIDPIWMIKVQYTITFLTFLQINYHVASWVKLFIHVKKSCS